MFSIPPEIAEKLGTFPQLTSEEYEKLRAEWGNEVKGEYDCPLCNGKGYTVSVDDSGNLACVECSCEAKRRSMKRIERSGLKDVLESYTFERFQTVYDWQKEMKRKAQGFLSDNEGKWFAAMGSVGSGKSHICTAICKELLDAGKEVRYMLWRDESMKIKAAATDGEEYERLIDPLKRVKVLYIDDLFKTQKGKEVTQADINLAFELLNYRYVNRSLVTVISSEKTIEEILDIDEAVGSRIYERCKEYYLRLSGKPNWRLR